MDTSTPKKPVVKNLASSPAAAPSSRRVAPKPLREFLHTILEQVGASDSHAHTVAEHLVESSMAGHDSHGAMRIEEYVKAIDSHDVSPSAESQVVQETLSGGVIDGQLTFGQVAGSDGMKLALKCAHDTGLGGVVVRNCYHTGRIASYALQAVREDCIGMVMANTGGGGQWVAPFGGLDRRLSTNPISIAAPSGGEFPICLDMATSSAPEGKIRDYLQKDRPIPEGWVIDCHGQSTTNPRDLYESPGVVLPLGGLVGGHKGFGLAFMVDILAGALSGAGCCRPDPHDFHDGLMIFAIDIGRFSGMSVFEDRIKELVRYVQSSRPAPGFDRVMVPGEWEFLCRRERETNGLPIPDSVWESFERLADRHEVELPGSN